MVISLFLDITWQVSNGLKNYGGPESRASRQSQRASRRSQRVYFLSILRASRQSQRASRRYQRASPQTQRASRRYQHASDYRQSFALSWLSANLHLLYNIPQYRRSDSCNVRVHVYSYVA